MKKLYIYAFVGILFFGTGGCKKLDTFGDTNIDPSTTTKPLMSALFTNACATIGGIATAGSGTVITPVALIGGVTPGIYSQYFTETQYNDISLYSLQQLSFTTYYNTVLNDLQTVIHGNQSNNMTQAAIILQQYVYWRITDAWGDVPYSEALQGISNIKPKYDKQEDIYKGMISKLKTAAAAFDAASSISGDVLNDGDPAAWKRVANSLRLLMALQLSKKYPAAGGYAATEFNAALVDAGGYITANEENFKADYPGGSLPNPWYDIYNGRKDQGESKTMTDLMASLSDTRQDAYGGLTELVGTPNSEKPSAVGVPYGLTRSQTLAFIDANSGWARVLRGDFRKETSTVVIISAAEVALARAEAADRGWTTESLVTVYNEGIDLSYDQWGLTTPAGYKTQANVVLGAVGTAANLGKIATQEYIASYPDGLRGWDIWRRTGFPALSPAPAATNASKQIPRRYAYAVTEYTSNKDAITAAVALLPGGDTQDSRVWWDQ